MKTYLSNSYVFRQPAPNQLVEHLDVSDLSKAEVLVALFNALRPTYSKDPDMTVAEAEGFIARADNEGRSHYAYVRGRALHVHLLGRTFNPFPYDQAHGKGAAARALAFYRASTRPAHAL